MPDERLRQAERHAALMVSEPDRYPEAVRDAALIDLERQRLRVGRGHLGALGLGRLVDVLRLRRATMTALLVDHVERAVEARGWRYCEVTHAYENTAEIECPPWVGRYARIVLINDFSPFYDPPTRGVSVDLGIWCVLLSLRVPLSEGLRNHIEHARWKLTVSPGAASDLAADMLWPRRASDPVADMYGV